MCTEHIAFHIHQNDRDSACAARLFFRRAGDGSAQRFAQMVSFDLIQRSEKSFCGRGGGRIKRVESPAHPLNDFNRGP